MLDIYTSGSALCESLIHQIIATWKFPIPWYISPVPLRIRQMVVIRAGVTCCHHFGCVVPGLKFWPQTQNYKHKIKEVQLWKNCHFLNQKARLPSIIWGFIIINVIILEPKWLNMQPKIRYTLNKVPPSLAMLVLRARNTSSWSTGEERSCRNAVRGQDWASLSFWLISGSKNSATSTAQRLGVNSWYQLRPVCMWLSALCGCSTPTAGPLKKTSEGDIVLLLRLAPCGRLCTDRSADRWHCLTA